MEMINLENYNSSGTQINLPDSIAHAAENKLNLDKISHRINYDNKMVLFDENILYNYRGYLDDFKVPIEIDEEYFYRPEMVAEEIYGTPDLWYLVMWMNEEIPSPLEFNQKYIWVFDPAQIEVLNTLIESNKTKLEENSLNPQYVDDITIKPVVISTNRVL